MSLKRVCKNFILIVVPAVLALWYGLWLFTGNAATLPALFGTLLLMLFSALYIRTILLGMKRARKTRPVLVEPICCERTTNVREILRLVVVFALARMAVYAAAYGWSLYRTGYTGSTVFSIQHIWADHPLAGIYVSLARNGYAYTAGEGYLNLSVMPLYSWLVRLFSPSGLSAVRAAFVLSNVNMLLAGVALYELMLMEKDRRSARHTAVFFCLLPGTFYLGCTVAGSTFLLFSVLCLYAIRKENFYLASLFGLLATLTEFAGVALILPAACDYVRSLKRSKNVGGEKRVAEACCLLLMVFLPVLFMLYQSFRITGDAQTFLREIGIKPFFFENGAESLGTLFAAYPAGEIRISGTAFLDAAALLGSLIVMLAAVPEIPTSYTLLYMGMLFLSSGKGCGANEMLACGPALFCAFGVATRKKKIYIPAALVSALLLFGGIGLYTAGTM